MKRAFIAILFAAAALFAPRLSQAATCPVVAVFTTGETLTATNLNANPTQFSNCFLNIDNTNIGSAGIYASQIKPTSAAQATFGGTQVYTIPNGAVGVSGTLNIAGLVAALGTSSVGIGRGTAGNNELDLYGPASSAGGSGWDFVTNDTTYQATISASGGHYAAADGANPGIVVVNNSVQGVYFGFSTSHVMFLNPTLSSTATTCGPLVSYYCATLTLNSLAAPAGVNDMECLGNESGGFNSSFTGYNQSVLWLGPAATYFYVVWNTTNTVYVGTSTSALAGTAVLIECVVAG